MLIPDATYLLTSETLNFIGQGLAIVGVGKPTLKFAGSGRAFILDAGGGGLHKADMRIENLRIVGNPSITQGWYSRGLARSVVRNIEVRECSLYGFNILFSVSVLFDTIKYSGNEDFGSLTSQSTRPQYGVHIGNDGAGIYTADCTFTNLISEDFTGTSLYVEDGSGNLFMGGTFEGTSIGLVMGNTCKRNHFINLWFEANSIRDVEVNGYNNAFTGCHFGSASSGINLEVVTAGGLIVTGGYLRAANLHAGSTDTTFVSVGFDQNLGGSLGIRGVGTYKTLACLKIDDSGVVVGQMNDVLGPVAAIKFAATQVPSTDVNTLDDYREGLWTGALVATTSGTITLDPSFNTGSYIKIGRQVTVTGIFFVSSIAAPVGDLYLTGLPFAAVNSPIGRAAGSVCADGLAATATSALMCRIIPGESQINIKKFQAGSVANLADDVTANTQFYISLTYNAAG